MQQLTNVFNKYNSYTNIQVVIIRYYKIRKKSVYHLIDSSIHSNSLIFWFQNTTILQTWYSPMWKRTMLILSSSYNENQRRHTIFKTCYKPTYLNIILYNCINIYWSAKCECSFTCLTRNYNISIFKTHLSVKRLAPCKP